MTSDRFYPSRPILAASVAVIRDGRILLAARASCGKVDSVFRPSDALVQEESIGWVPKVQIHFWVRCCRGKPPSEGLYSLPGGMVETGETLGEAALRELREDVGVEAKLIGLIAPVEFIERDEKGDIKHHVVIAAHAARWVSGEPQTGPEAKDIRWITERDIADLPLTEGLAGILEQAFRLGRVDAPA